MQGHLRAIGVSNFGVGHLEKLAATTEVLPAVNQIELTPFLQRKKLVDYCKSHDILLEVPPPPGIPTPSSSLLLPAGHTDKRAAVVIF